MARLPFGLDLPDRPPREVIDEARRKDPALPRTIEVGIPMRDGVELAADVHLPAASRLPAPVIVTGTPYDKSWIPADDLRRRVEAGYACVYYDIRGRGKSEGEWHPFAGDGLDGHDVVEWLATQEWCDGKVAIDGQSYSGWVVWATLREGPKALRAALSTSAAGRWQEELPYLHGCFLLYYAWWFSYVRRRIGDTSVDVPALLEMLPVEAMTEVLNSAGPGWEEVLEHDTLDALWQERRMDGDYAFDVPCLHVTGWHDREDIWGAFHHYQEMISQSPAGDQQWLVVGPWSHTSSHYPSDGYCSIESPSAGIDINGIQIRFLDHVLREIDEDFQAEPRIQLYDSGAKRWKTRPSWLGETQEMQLFLAEGATMSAAPGVDGSDSYRYDPLEPNGWAFDVEALPWEPPLDLGELESQAGVLAWTSAPLTSDITVRGWGRLDLWAATDGEDTDWHAKLADVDPTGRSLCVAWGCLRASYGADPSVPAAVIPDEENLYGIELTPSFHTFTAGHRIRILLASSEYPWFARNLNQFGPIAKQERPRVAVNTVHYGQRLPSSLRLAIEPDSPMTKPPAF